MQIIHLPFQRLTRLKANNQNSQGHMHVNLSLLFSSSVKIVPVGYERVYLFEPSFVCKTLQIGPMEARLFVLQQKKQVTSKT